MIVASLIKEFQLASELNHMKGIVPDDILDALKKKKLGLPGIDVEAPEQKNAMMAGQFEVILELLEAYKDGDQGKIAKAQVSFNQNFFCSKTLFLPNPRVSQGIQYVLHIFKVFKYFQCKFPNTCLLPTYMSAYSGA